MPRAGADPDSTDRYHASESVIGGAIVVVVGLGMTLGFGAIAVDAYLDLRAYPDAPRPVTVAEAAALARPPRASWVRLTDARIDCRYPPSAAFSGSAVYALLTDATGGPHLLVSLPGPAPASCDEAFRAPYTGVLAASTPGRIVGLTFPGLDWSAWPTRHLTVLWTASGPSDSRGAPWIGVLVLPGLLGLAGGLGSVRRGLGARRAPAPPLREPSLLAMPLSTGASSLALFGGALVIVQLVVFGPLFVATHLPDWTVYPIGVLWAAWFFGALGWLFDCWKRRASDLLLGRTELAVRGGPLHRTRVPFRGLDPRRFALERSVLAAEGAAGPGDDRATLILDGEVAAVCRDEEEERSLAALVDTIHALAAQAAGARRPPPTGRPPGVVECGACGAPVAPSDADEVPCGHCGAGVTLPAEVRLQTAALGRLSGARAESERMLRRLLRQPGAHRTNLLLLLATPPLLLGWPLCAILFDEMFQTRHLFTWHHGVSLFVAALSFTYGLSWLLRAEVAGRAAVRLVTTRFAAVPPEAPGEPSSCHRCGGPLPQAAPEQLVAICVYCRSENVLGTNLSPVARREEGQARDLGAELRARLAERRRYRLISLASLLLLAVSVASLGPVWRTLRGG